MRHIKLPIFALALGLLIALGCEQKREAKDAFAQELLADSSSRSIVEHKIASDHRMATEMMPLLMEHMDSMMANGVCMNMMSKAHSDRAMAGHMCDMMASDTMMSGMMRSKMGAGPVPSSSQTDHAAHHPDSEEPKRPRGHTDHPAIKIP